MRILRFVLLLGCVSHFVLTPLLRAAQAPPTARQIIERIQQNVGVPWTTPTVDTLKAGDPNTPVTGIAVTMMATYEVLEKAAAAGDNLVITHEPTFYNHQDSTADLAKQHDPVLEQKQQFIRDHHMVVWRFHDHWHARNPDGILLGMTKALGWQEFEDKSNPHLYRLPATTAGDLAVEIKRKLNIRALRLVGDPTQKLSQVALLPGAAGSARQIQLLERNDVEALVIGETPEWETVEYVTDAAHEGRAKALVILGHIPSEQAGMEECSKWLTGFIHDVTVSFVPSSEPFVTP